MPGRDDAPAAARFVITFDDGRAIGEFEMLFAATAPGAMPRALQVHELPLVWHHAYALRSGKFTPADYNFELPSQSTQPGQRQRPTIILKRGTGRRVSLAHWQALGRCSIALVGLSFAGQPIVCCQFRRAWVVKITGPTMNAKGGGDVAMEEIVIEYEQVSLSQPGYRTDRPADPRIREP